MFISIYDIILNMFLTYILIILFMNGYSSFIINSLKPLPLIIIDHNEKFRPILKTLGNTLDVMSAQDFKEVMRKIKIHSFMILIFVEKELNVEDFTIKDKNGTAFPNMQYYVKKSIARYIPLVETPYVLLRQSLPIKYYFPITFYTYLTEKQKNETRVEMLRRHDREIIEMVDKARDKYANEHSVVVSFYTGMGGRTPWEDDEEDNHEEHTSETEKRDEVTTQKANYEEDRTEPGALKLYDIDYLDSWVHIALGGTHIDTPKSSVVMDHNWIDDFSGVSIPSEDGHILETTIKSPELDLAFHFDFRLDNEDWQLYKIMISDGEVLDSVPMYAIARWGQSCRCDDEPIVLVHRKRNRTIVIPSYRVQVLGKKPANVRFFSGRYLRFGSAVFCGSCFTVPILTGLMISSLLLCVLFYGVITIMDCQGNNRYDSSSDKPLVITEEN